MHKLLDKFRRKLSFFVPQPFQDGVFLTLRDPHELLGFALQLEFVRIDEEQLSAKMPDAAANLPGHQRILVGGIVADHQDGFRLIQLLHGEQGIGGALAERGDESSVIGAAVMIDVVGAKSRAREALQQIILLV